MKLRKLCGALNGAAMLGLALLWAVSGPTQRLTQRGEKDIVAAILWSGCKTEGLRRLKAEFFPPKIRF